MARRSPVDRVFGAVVPRAVDAVDPDELLARIDVDQLVERLDVDALIQRVDVDALIQRVDVDALVQRVDVDALIQRVDVDALIQRVDVNRLVAGVDVRALVARAGIDQVVAEATTGMATRTLDLARRLLVGVDVIVLGLVDRVLRRPPAVGVAAVRTATGRPAGPLSRLLAFLVDTVAVSTSFSVGIFLAGVLGSSFTGRPVDEAAWSGPGWAVAYGVWWFLYLWISLTVTGRTVGKALVGLRVVARDRTPLSPTSALVRTVAFPFSFVLGLGFVPAVLGRERRAVHDLVARSCEVVDWGGRHGELTSPLAAWLAGHGVPADAVAVVPAPVPNPAPEGDGDHRQHTT